MLISLGLSGEVDLRIFWIDGGGGRDGLETEPLFDEEDEDEFEDEEDLLLLALSSLEVTITCSDTKVLFLSLKNPSGGTGLLLQEKLELKLLLEFVFKDSLF